MFVDTVTVYLKSGRGGDGCCAFHREKFVPNGGPDGGDGGNGGDVVFIGDPNTNNLAKFRHSPKFYAESGHPGQGSMKTGKRGKDLKVRVPCGTVVRKLETNEILCEVLEPDQRIVVAKGGYGGKGNYHFATSTNQAPRTIEYGKEGESFKAVLELKIIADVGLVGLPNAGKSSLIASVSHAKPKIANYAFTTLQPNLGVIELKDYRTIVMADIPGIIEGASEGKGLGIQFLKHVERTKLLLFILDVSDYADTNPVDAFKMLKEEIHKFGHGLPEKKILIAANKMDLDSERKALKTFMKSLTKTEKNQVIPVSAATRQGLEELISRLDKELSDLL